MSDLVVTVDSQTLTATWTDTNPNTRVALADALPVAGDAARWGDELYFTVPVDVDVEAESARRDVPVGAIAYWPTGNALCFFWGPTPASTDDTPRAASPVSVVAMLDDPTPLEQLSGGAQVSVEPT